MHGLLADGLFAKSLRVCSGITEDCGCRNTNFRSASMIKRFTIVAAVMATLGTADWTSAQSATPRDGQSPTRRIVFNPFAPFSTGRILVGRLGLPKFQSGLTLLSQPAVASSVTPQPQPAASPAVTIVPTAIEVGAATPSLLITRPPYRPPVRSPYRPPPRPPF